MSKHVWLSGSRFVAGEAPDGLGLKLFLAPEGVVTGILTPELRHEGPPGHAHGGFSVALLDEVMGAAVWRAGYQVVSVKLTTDFRAPVPIGVEITVRGQVDRVEGGKIHTVGSITLPGGQIAVEGRGLWIEWPEMFKDADYRPMGSTRED